MSSRWKWWLSADKLKLSEDIILLGQVHVSFDDSRAKLDQAEWVRAPILLFFLAPLLRHLTRQQVNDWYLKCRWSSCPTENLCWVDLSPPSSNMAHGAYSLFHHQAYGCLPNEGFLKWCCPCKIRPCKCWKPVVWGIPVLRLEVQWVITILYHTTPQLYVGWKLVYKPLTGKHIFINSTQKWLFIHYYPCISIPMYIR